VKVGKRTAKFEDKMDGREECRIVECEDKRIKHGEGEREILSKRWVCQ
jgi:hypothetical protein